MSVISSNDSYSEGTTTPSDTSRDDSPFLDHRMAKLSEEAKTSFTEQDEAKNMELFHSLLNDTETELEFAALFDFLYSAHFRGSYQCLHLTIQKLENRYPALMEEFKEEYLFPGDENIPNIHAVNTLVQKKTMRIASQITVIDEDDLFDTIKESVQNGILKKAFIVADTSTSPPHYYTVGFQKLGTKIHLFLGESVAPDKYQHLSSLYLKTKRLSMGMNATFLIYHYKYARQKDLCTCPHFAINDAVQFIRESNFFGSMPKSFREDKAQMIEVEEIPPSLMKFTQFTKAPLYHTYSSLKDSCPNAAAKVGRYVTEAGDNFHSLLKRKRSLSHLLTQFIQTRCAY